MTVFWDWLRLTRSDPPGLAKGDPVASATYRASLEQFEELIKAAGSVGYAARPLPLFYALSQAGRAIVAARGGSDHQVHGLVLDRKTPPDLLDAIVGPQTSTKQVGQFQAVASALNSPLIIKPVPIGALIHSLPEMSIELTTAIDWPKALPVFDIPWEHVHVPGQTRIAVVFQEERISPADLVAVLAKYPNAKAIGPSEFAAKTYSTLPTIPTPMGDGVDLFWIGDKTSLNEQIPEYRFKGYRWLRPSVVDSNVPPSALMTWWILLFGLSMLARYHPVPWTQALDIDSSGGAVTLEVTMNRALDALPHLVFEAILNQPVKLIPSNNFDPFL